MLAHISEFELNRKVLNAIAGFTGLAFNYVSLLPASNMAPRYDPAKIIVYTAASFVNLVFCSVDERYMKTRKNDPIPSSMHYWTKSPGSTLNFIFSSTPAEKIDAKIFPRIAPTT